MIIENRGNLRIVDNSAKKNGRIYTDCSKNLIENNSYLEIDGGVLETYGDDFTMIHNYGTVQMNDGKLYGYKSGTQSSTSVIYNEEHRKIAN